MSATAFCFLPTNKKYLGSLVMRAEMAVWGHIFLKCLHVNLGSETKAISPVREKSLQLSA